MHTNVRAVFAAGIAVGLLDGLAAVINSAIRGVSPERVFQYIASGLLGRTSYEMGATAVILGVFLHFVVAIGAAGVFVIAALQINWLGLRPLIAGPIYGVLVYIFMAEVIRPLSAAAALPRTLTGTITGILIHIAFVGLPIALITSFYCARATPPAR